MVIHQLAVGDTLCQFVGAVAPGTRARVQHLADSGLKCQGGGQIGGTDGLAKRPEHPQLMGFGELFRGLQYPDVLAADQHHAALVAYGSKVAQQFNTVDIRHIEVAEHQVGVIPAIAQQRHRLPSGAEGRDPLETEHRQLMTQEGEHQGVIVDDHNARLGVGSVHGDSSLR